MWKKKKMKLQFNYQDIKLGSLKLNQLKHEVYGYKVEEKERIPL